jgi:hypothetical protein
MTTITLNVASTIVLPDGRTALVLDGPVPTATASKAIAATTPVQTTPKPKARKPRKALSPEAVAKQVAFWTGKASKSQIGRIKEAGSTKRDSTLAKMTALEARAELGRVNPAAKLSVIAPEVLDAIKALATK